jgi:RNA polymerase sigma-70 factor (ECF subfamily)
MEGLSAADPLRPCTEFLQIIFRPLAEVFGQVRRLVTRTGTLAVTEPLSETDYAMFHAKADAAAIRFVRRYHLPAADRDDIRHQLLVIVLERIDTFDPSRGTLGAFVTVLVKNGLSIVVARLRRHRSLFSSISLDEPAGLSGSVAFGESFSNADGYLAWMSSVQEPVTQFHRQLALSRALNTLSPEQVRFLKGLATWPIGRLCEINAQSRATVYRRLNEIQLRMLAAGVGPQT